jgi:alanyl-tRNA synthetase
LKVGELVASAVSVGGVKLITAKLENAGSETLRSMGDKIRDLDASAVAVLADVKGDSVTFAATAGKDAQAAGVMSGKLVAAIAAITGGKGGGRPDFAMAGAKDVAKVDEALAEASNIVAGMLK